MQKKPRIDTNIRERKGGTRSPRLSTVRWSEQTLGLGLFSIRVSSCSFVVQLNGSGWRGVAGRRRGVLERNGVVLGQRLAEMPFLKALRLNSSTDLRYHC